MTEPDIKKPQVIDEASRVNVDHLLNAVDYALTQEEQAQHAVDEGLQTMKKSFEVVKESLNFKKTFLDNKAKEELAPIVSITDADNLKETRKLIASANAAIKEVGEMRMNTTRPLDDFKKDLMAVEKTICLQLSTQSARVKLLCDAYEVAEAKRVADLRAAKQREIEVQKAREELAINLRTEAKINFEKHVDGMATELRKRFAALTLENFDENIALMDKFKPLLKPDIHQGFFVASYNTDLLTPEDIEAEKTAAIEAFSHLVASTEYILKIDAVVSELKERAPTRRDELEAVAQLASVNQKLADTLAAQQKQAFENEDKLRQQQTRQAEDSARAAAASESQVKSLEADLQGIEAVQSAGVFSVKTSLIKATVSTPTAYRGLLDFYLKSGGDTAKLDFLCQFAAKNGRPEIAGVTYNV